jgi:hypothetical protein
LTGEDLGANFITEEFSLAPTLHMQDVSVDLARRIAMPKVQRTKKDKKRRASTLIESSTEHVAPRSIERIPTLEELVAKITKKNRHPETDWGPDPGKEIGRW